MTDPQIDIRNKELKKNFSDMYDMINDVIDRINDISKDADMLKPMEFISNNLADLNDRISDYLNYTFATKPYTENLVNYRIFMATLVQINDMLSQIKPGEKPKHPNENGLV